jgi:hypothetical protein
MLQRLEHLGRSPPGFVTGSQADRQHETNQSHPVRITLADRGSPRKRLPNRFYEVVSDPVTGYSSARALLTCQRFSPAP